MHFISLGIKYLKDAFECWQESCDLLKVVKKGLPRVSGVWKRSIQRKAVTEKRIISIFLKQSLRFSLVVRRQVHPPRLKQDRIWEQFFHFFLFGSLVWILGLCLLPSFVLLLLFDVRFSIFCSFSLPVPIIHEKFVHGFLPLPENLENGDCTGEERVIDKNRLGKSDKIAKLFSFIVHVLTLKH